MSLSFFQKKPRFPKKPPRIIKITSSDSVKRATIPWFPSRAVDQGSVGLVYNLNHLVSLELGKHLEEGLHQWVIPNLLLPPI